MVSSSDLVGAGTVSLLGPPPRGTLRYIPLGGMGEIGKNLALLEAGEDVVVVDAGLAFPEEASDGADVVLPDIAFLKTRLGRLRAVLLTHGHEDHIGALPFFLQELGVPVYGTRMTIGLLRNKLERRGFVGHAALHEVRLGETVQIGQLSVELFHMTHSVPGSCGLAIHTPAGLVVHTGDFKLDQSPIDGQFPDLGRLRRLGEEGVLMLLSDSTNATVDGLTPSELTVRPALGRAMAEAPGRVLVVTFASNLARMRQALELAGESGRRCCLVGRSMLRNVDTARSLGYLHLPPGLLVGPRELAGIPPRQLCLLATGSQGEPLAALSRIAAGTHPFIRLRDDDTLVLAANPIPGNETTIQRIVNRLVERGVRVLAGSAAGVHASGHAAREELRFLLEVVRPRYFIPIHGEARHLAAHAALALGAGLGPDQLAVIRNGTVVEVAADRLRVAGSVRVGATLVDSEGKRLQRTGEGQRQLVVSLRVTPAPHRLVGDPELTLLGTAIPDEVANVAGVEVALARSAHGRRAFADLGGMGQEVASVVQAHLEASGSWRPELVTLVSVD
ncbi:MAG: ribonuclease J [Candidatus Dormibacteria bacterium]